MPRAKSTGRRLTKTRGTRRNKRINVELYSRRFEKRFIIRIWRIEIYWLKIIKVKPNISKMRRRR